MTVARYVITAVTAVVTLAGGVGAAVAEPGDSQDLREVVLTNADNGRAVTVTPGETVTVRLGGPTDQGPVWAWSAPTAAVPRVLERTASTSAPDGDSTATFRAESPGSGDVTSYRKCVPTPGVMCSKIVVPWKVAVTVEVG